MQAAIYMYIGCESILPSRACAYNHHRERQETGGCSNTELQALPIGGTGRIL